jgi:hypothetical protein
MQLSNSRVLLNFTEILNTAIASFNYGLLNAVVGRCVEIPQNFLISKEVRDVGQIRSEDMSPKVLSFNPYQVENPKGLNVLLTEISLRSCNQAGTSFHSQSFNNCCTR